MPSTVIASLTYDAPVNELTVRFVSGSVYRYYHVPQEVYEEWLASRAKGIFYNREIKNKYKHARVDAAERG